MFNRYFLISILLTTFSIFLFNSSIQAQVPIPNGGFEQWEDRFIMEAFEPYETSNLFTFTIGQAPNVTSVAGENGGKAIRIETVPGDGDNQNGIIYSGTVGPIPAPGFPFSGQPDSIFLRMRYDIMPGDTAGFVLFFFSGGNLAAPPLIETFQGQDMNWNTWALDLGTFSSMPDSATLLLTSSWFDDTPPVLGSWLEVDEITFSDTSVHLMNESFSDIDSLTAHDPVDWISPNDFAQVISNGEMIASEADGVDAYEGNASLRLTTTVVSFGNEKDTVGFLLNSDQYVPDDNGGKPYTGMAIPQIFRGYYKYHPAGNDTALTLLRFSVWDANGDSSRMIGEYQGTVLPAATDYIKFSVDLDLNEMPDTFWVAFGSSDIDHILSEAEPGVGSELYLDALEFYDGVTSIDPWEKEALALRFYPNPASQFVNIEYEALPGVEYKISLYTLSGQIISQEKINPVFMAQKNIHQLNLENITPGVYFLSVFSENDDLIHSEKLMIRK